MTTEQENQLTSETVHEQLAGEVKACVLKGEGCKKLAKRFEDEAKKLGIGAGDLFDQVFDPNKDVDLKPF